MTGTWPGLRVFIAENNPWVRQSLRIFLVQYLDFEIEGETDTLEGLPEAAAACTPDLLIIAWDLPGKVDGQLIGELRMVRPEMKIVAISSQPELEKAAIQAGADAGLGRLDLENLRIEELELAA